MKPTQHSFRKLVVAAVGTFWACGVVPPTAAGAETSKAALPTPQPTISGLIPAGVTRGTSVDLTVQGVNLAPVIGVRVDGSGVSAELVPPPTGKSPNPRQARIRLTATADAKLGMRELRLITPGGTSNVARFVVSALSEVVETEPNDTAAVAMPLSQLPLVVNGALNRNEDRDCFRFSAKAGQTIVFDLCGRQLHPYVANQRPGWLEGLLTVCEATELGQAADAYLLAEAAAAQKAAAAKQAGAVVAARRNAVNAAAAARTAADKMLAAKVAAAAKANQQLAQATVAAKDAAAALAAAQKDAAAKADALLAAKARFAAAQATAKANEAGKVAAAKDALDKANAEKVSADKAVAEKTAAAKSAQEKLAAVKAAADKAAAENASAEKAAKDKAAALQAANQQLAKAAEAAKNAADQLAAANRELARRRAVRDKIAEKRLRPLAYAHDYGGRQDPLLVFTVPKDGQYVVEVHDELFRGRSEFNYRLTIGEVPFVTRAFPAGGQRGTTVSADVQGFNLNGANELRVTFPADEPLDRLRYARTVDTSNDLVFEPSEDPEVLEAEPNDSLDHATPTQFPAVLNGVIEHDGDLDNFKFRAAKGQRLIFQTVSQSLRSPLDPRLNLYDINGRRLKNSDDVAGTFDAAIDYTFAADGEYVIQVRDTLGFGSSRHVYRLHVHEPRPDFSLTVSPDNPRVTAGGTVALKVLAQRREGFSGDIELTVPNPPAGVIVSPAVLSGKRTEETLTITMPAGATPRVVPFEVVGKAKIGDHDVVHKAVPAEQIRYVNAWRYVPVGDLLLSVLPPAPISLSWAPSDVKIVSGQTAEVTVKVRRAPGFAAPIRLTLQGLPPRVAAPPVTISENATEAVVEIRAYNGAVADTANVVANGTVTFQGRSYIQSTPALRLHVAQPEKEKKK